MTKAEAIKKMFPHKTQAELSNIWEEVYEPHLTAITGKIMINPIALDDLFVKENGEYNGSFKDEILEKCGEEVLKAILE